MITENLSTLKIHKLSQEQYDREREAGRLYPNELYLTPDNSPSGNIEVDQEYNPESENAQSGIAVAQAIEGTTDIIKDTVVQEILAELQGLPVFGVVDENNIITVTSQLSDGTYTLRYENEDGTTTEIGTIIVGTGSGGNDTPTYVNLVPTAKTPTDFSTVFNNGLGYMDGKYASSASPFYGDDSETFVTGAIESEKNSVFYIKGVTITPSASHHRLSVLGIKGNCEAAKPFSQMTDYADFETLGTQYYKLTMKETYMNEHFNNFKYIMISAAGSGANCIISKTPIE